MAQIKENISVKILDQYQNSPTLSTDDRNMVYRQQQQQQKTLVVSVEMEAPIQNTAHVPQTTLLSDLKEKRAYVQCPHCLQNVYTKVSRDGGVLFFICFLSCAAAFILFHMLYMVFFQIICVSSLQDKAHTCPSCKTRIAKYKRLGKTTSIIAASPINRNNV